MDAALSPRLRLFPSALLCLSLLLAGCASVGVAPRGGNRLAEAQRPERLRVSPFDFTRCEMNVDRAGADLAALQKEIADGLAADIVERSPSLLGLKAEIAAKPPVEAEASWLVRGRFTRINQGSRAMRSLFGFGSGGTKMEARVEVYDLSSPSLEPLFSFATSGGSGASPGAVLSSNPYSFAASAAIGAAGGVTDDRERTARMILAYVAEQLAARGWLPAAAQAPGAKRLDADDTSKLEGDDAPTPDDDGRGTTSHPRQGQGWRSK